VIISTQKTLSQNPFIGTWEYANNNQVFQVILYNDPDFASANHLIGDYKLIERINGVETLIYKSNFEFDSPVGLMNVGYEIFGSRSDKYFSGLVNDNTTDYQLGWRARKTKQGSLLMMILLPDISCPTCINAKWKITPLQGITFDTVPDEYNIPTDVIMTKVN
jgi:hypothetical protein